MTAGPASGYSQPMVGRTRELDMLAKRLDAAGSEHGGVVLISGEPGIGKTRLLAEFSARAQRGGWLVLSGHAYDTEGMPPYLPFAEAISQQLRTATEDEAVNRLVQAAREVALLVPALSERLVDAPTPASFGPAADRYRLFEAVTDFFLQLSATSEAKGLLLCLDDLHWADPSTLLLFQHLARKLKSARMLVVGAYRGEEVDPAGPLFDVLAELAREQQDQRLSLSRLSAEETSALVASLSSKPPGAKLVKEIHEQTAGNPFFVHEIMRQLQSQGASLEATTSSPKEWGLSEGVRQVIGRRMSRLSAETQKLLESAAVLGDGFDQAILGAAAGAEATIVTSALEESTHSGMLTERDGGFVFGHPLIRQAIYESLSLPRRQALHLCAGKAIEAAYGANLERHLAALATHYYLAGTEAPETTIDYATQAGDRATAVFAFDEALRLYDIALSVLELRGDAGQKTPSAELHVRRGTALSGLARWVETRAAFEAGAAGLSGGRRADVLLMLANAGTSGPPDVPNARRCAVLALELAGELGRPDLEMAANALLAQADQAEGKFKSALVQYERAYAQSKSLPPVRQHRVFPQFPLGLYYAGRIGEAVELGRETVESAVAAHDSPTTVVTYGNLGLALTSSGRYKEALQAFAAARETASQYGAPGIQSALARASGMSASPHMETFDFARAEAVADEAREIGRSANFVLPVISEGIDLITIGVRRGDLSGVDDLVTEVTQNLDKGGGAHGALWLARLTEARAELALVRGDNRQALELASEALELARALGRPKYEALALTSQGKALVGLRRQREGTVLLRQAVEAARPVGDPAMFLRAAAAVLAVDPDRALAAASREAAERILANLPGHMKPGFLAAEPVRLIYALNGTKSAAAPHRPAYPDGLTEREVEVLGLIAGGQSNREVADQLVVSVRTVERHITNIYAKIGARGKADATAYALRNSLI